MRALLLLSIIRRTALLNAHAEYLLGNKVPKRFELNHVRC